MCGKTEMVVMMGCVMELGVLVLSCVMTLILRIMVAVLAVEGGGVSDGGSNTDGENDVMACWGKGGDELCVMEVVAVEVGKA